MLSDQPFSATESASLRSVLSFMRAGVLIPDADTIRADIVASYKIEQAYLRQKLQVKKSLRKIKKKKEENGVRSIILGKTDQVLFFYRLIFTY